MEGRLGSHRTSCRETTCSTNSWEEGIGSKIKDHSHLSGVLAATALRVVGESLSESGPEWAIDLWSLVFLTSWDDSRRVSHLTSRLERALGHWIRYVAPWSLISSSLTLFHFRLLLGSAADWKHRFNLWSFFSLPYRKFWWEESERTRDHRVARNLRETRIS